MVVSSFRSAQRLKVFLQRLRGLLEALRAQLEAIQPNLAAMMLRDVWAEHAPNVSGAVARKTVVISTTRVLQVPEVLISTPDPFLALLQAAAAANGVLDRVEGGIHAPICYQGSRGVR